MGKFEFSNYCTPAQLYLVLAGISILAGFFKNFRFITLAVKALFVFIWAWILNWLCRKGLQAVSWILVLLPFILFALTFFALVDIKSNGDMEGFEGQDLTDFDNLKSQVNALGKKVDEAIAKQE